MKTSVLIEYNDGRGLASYSDCAPSIDLEEQAIVLCDDENGVIDEFSLKGVECVTFEQKP